MALAGQAVMVNWCDVAEENRKRFHTWHTRHHMVDRVGISGFHRCRRYRAVSAACDYFFVYEVDSLGVLSSSDYLNRLNNPSPITRSNHGLILNAQRLIGGVKRSLGVGQGGTLMTLRIDVNEDAQESVERYLADNLLPTLVDQPDVVGAHLVETNQVASAVTRPGGRPPGQLPNWVLIVEALSPSAIEPLCVMPEFERTLRERFGTCAIARDTFMHQVTISKLLSWNP